MSASERVHSAEGATIWRAVASQKRIVRGTGAPGRRKARGVPGVRGCDVARRAWAAPKASRPAMRALSSACPPKTRSRTELLPPEQAWYREALLRRISGFWLALWVGSLAACAPTRVAAAPGSHDRAVPPNEPRAELSLTLDLPRTASCEEDFDLKLYTNMAVDLIEWSKGPAKCSGRRVKIRYLSRRTDAEKLMAEVKTLANNAKVLP